MRGVEWGDLPPEYRREKGKRGSVHHNRASLKTWGRLCKECGTWLYRPSGVYPKECDFCPGNPGVDDSLPDADGPEGGGPDALFGVETVVLHGPDQLCSLPGMLFGERLELGGTGREVSGEGEGPDLQQDHLG